MSIDSWTHIWKHAFLCNLSNKFSGNAELYAAEDLLNALNHFKKTFKLSHSYPVMLQGNFLWNRNKDSDLNTKIRKHLKRVAVINEILNIGNGKISLCGGSIVSIISKFLGGNCDTGDYDFFFHCDAKEADCILEKCLNYISKYFNEESKHTSWIASYVRNHKVITCSMSDMKIQFIMKLYHNKSRILLGFDMPGCQFGYNPKDSLFVTLQGLIAFVTRSFPVDLTQRCNAYEARLAKYYKKGYSIILPGLGGDWEGFQNKKLAFAKSNIINTYTMTMLGDAGDPSGYEPINESILGLTLSPLYFNFYSTTAQGLFVLDDSDILLTLNKTLGYQGRNIYETEKPDHFCENNSNAKQFLGDQRYQSVEIYNRESLEFRSAWNDAQIEWKVLAFELAPKLRLSKWEYDDLVSKDFGKFHPVPPEHNEWYGERYKPVHIGIGNSEFQAFMDCRKNIEYIASLPQELFKMICCYWFNAEVRDAIAHVENIFGLEH